MKDIMTNAYMSPYGLLNTDMELRTKDDAQSVMVLKKTINFSILPNENMRINISAGIEENPKYNQFFQDFFIVDDEEVNCLEINTKADTEENGYLNGLKTAIHFNFSKQSSIAIGYKDIEIAKLLEDTITVVERINIQVNGNFFNITVYIFFKES